MLTHPWRRTGRRTRSQPIAWNASPKRYRRRLSFEVLEDRCLLSADMVLQWNDILLDAIRVDRTPPPQASRAMAIVQAAVYEAVNSIAQVYTPYLVHIPAPPGSSPEAATAEAARDTLVALFPAQQTQLDAQLTASLDQIPDGPAKSGGIEVGRAAAQILLAVRRHDGAAAVVPYTPGTQPGDWQPTAPAYLPALAPQWPNVTPFCMSSGSEHRPQGPPALDSADYLADLQEVRNLGAINSHSRTFEQTVIALFWADGAGTATPPGHWNLIARRVAEAQGNTLLDNARLFALLDMALADAAIVAWDAKYAFDFWRPITAIRHDLDAAWEPLIVTPPFPTYTSGHSTFSGTAAAVLTAFFGTDNISFTTQSDDLPRTTRSFTSFSQAANEAGRSRIYGGIHYEFDNRDALAAGTALGQYVAENFLLPLSGAGAGGRGHLAYPDGWSVLLHQAPRDAISAFTVGLDAGDGGSIRAGLPWDSLGDGTVPGAAGTAGPARSTSRIGIDAEGAQELGKQDGPSHGGNLLFGSPEWQEGLAFSSPRIAGDV
jgi:hypothetical protein